MKTGSKSDHSFNVIFSHGVIQFYLDLMDLKHKRFA